MSGRVRRGTGRRAHQRDNNTPGERTVAGPQFPYGMRNVEATYASSASTDVVAYEDLPG
jgi:hypothetical protein